MPISATELARAYPDEHDDLPPPIKFLLKQTVTFEVQLPRHTHTNTYNDFKISKILGLKVNRSQLISQLPPPPPPPPRSPRFSFSTLFSFTATFLHVFTYLFHV
ncbi:hypothetical protein LINPERPRIM_LOCUS5197 [Linum perenne]